MFSDVRVLDLAVRTSCATTNMDAAITSPRQAPRGVGEGVAAVRWLLALPDTVHCGPGTKDKVFFDEGADDVAKDCEIKKPTPVPCGVDPVLDRTKRK